MEPRDKRDLPEVVAEILIEQHAMREDIAGLRRDMQEMRGEIGGLRQEMKEEIGGLRQEMKEEIGGLRKEMKDDNAALRQELRSGLDNMAQTFNNMTNAILDAMNRGNDRYYATNDRQDGTGREIEQLKTRVTNLENPAPDAT